ncbi:tRNA N(3)-methylcytidine methyltransferase METTL2-like [Lytechinus pictus]|uniref:tRNA N(3)-methylcytidine methyltransferase METTL2-like n=1 Tax=Lytechinus pictus TaxID=7653 RepID=UPI0030B9D231
MLVCNFLRQRFALGPRLIKYHLKELSSVPLYQIRRIKKLHSTELLKRSSKYQESNTGKKMSAAEEMSVAQGEGKADKRPQFGNRYLENPDNVFQHNAWDNVAWDPEQLEAAKKKVDENSSQPVNQEKRELYEAEADRYWNEFYSQHQNKFFKDRHWLFTEFPELSSDCVQVSGKETGSESGISQGTTEAEAVPQVRKAQRTLESDPQNTLPLIASEGEGNEDCGQSSASTRTCSGEAKADESLDDNVDFPGKSASKRILEVGCGVGNTIFPILQTNADPSLFVYGCDFSSVAVDIVRQHAEYNSSRCHAFVCDISDPASKFPFPDNSLDLIVLIFVMSAINPERFLSTIQTLTRLLKPGGRILFRDYGRYDMAQLRFKKGRCLSDNFYVRGDGTRVYFFTQDELQELFSSAGLIEEQNIIDRRLQVNRGRQLTMYRVWIQCKYRKP